MSRSLPHRDDADVRLVSWMSTLTARLAPARTPASPDEMVQAARAAVPHAQHAALILLRPQRPSRTLACSDTVAKEVDRLQYLYGHGPSVDAAGGAGVVRSKDVGVDARWPAFGPHCFAATGVRSALALPLPLGSSDSAALGLYSRAPHAFTGEDAALATTLAPLIALAVEAHLRQQDVANLHAALATSRTIGAAVGILMASHHLDRDQAFEVLRQASMHLNTKLRDVAEVVERTGALPSAH